MTGHVFISYSPADATDYVDRLTAHLADAGIRVWVDNEIITGQRWAQLICDKINTCVALVVVMTPAADESGWVDREILQAQQMDRPILPVLLKGTPFFALANIGYEDARSGTLPRQAFVAKLLALFSVSSPATDSSRDDPVELTRRQEHAIGIGDAGDVAESTRLLRDVVADQSRVLGREHESTVTSRYQLACGLAELGEPAEAAELFRDLIGTFSRLVGHEHFLTLVCREKLATATNKAGNPSEAARLLQELVVDRTRILGPDDADTLKTRYELARYTPDRAETYRRLAADYTRALGADHMGSLASQHQLAAELIELDDETEAIEILNEVILGYARVLGADNYRTLKARQQLAETYNRIGDYTNGLRLFRELANDFSRTLGPDDHDTRFVTLFLKTYNNRPM